jgi:hypothetical protein
LAELLGAERLVAGCLALEPIGNAAHPLPTIPGLLSVLIGVHIRVAGGHL